MAVSRAAHSAVSSVCLKAAWMVASKAACSAGPWVASRAALWDEKKAVC
jgi:hypothetical protein